MATSPRRLRRLRAMEVSFVNRGANKRPFLCLKSQDGAPMSDLPERERPMSEQLLLTPEQEGRIDGLLAERASRVAKDDEGLAPLDERAQAALKAVYRILLPFKDQLTDDDIDALLDEVGFGEGRGDDGDDADEVATDDETLDKSATTNTTEDDMAKCDDDEMKKAAGKMPWDKEPDDKEKPKFMKAKKAAAKAWKAAWDEDDKTEKAADDDDDEETQKSAVSKSDGNMLDGLPAEARRYFEMVTKRADEANRALIAKSQQLEGDLKRMQDERVLKGYEERVKAEFSHLAIDPAKTARVMKSMADRDDDGMESYLETLRQANEQARVSKSFGAGGMYGSIGRSGEGGGWSAPAGDAESRLESMVNNYVAKAETGISKAAAYDRVMATQEGKALYAEMRAEQGGR